MYTCTKTFDISEFIYQPKDQGSQNFSLYFSDEVICHLKVEVMSQWKIEKEHRDSGMDLELYVPLSRGYRLDPMKWRMSDFTRDNISGCILGGTEGHSSRTRGHWRSNSY